MRRRRKELSGLLGEVEEDGVAVEDFRVAIDDGRYFAIRIDRKVFGLELIALARIDGDRLVRQLGLFQEERHFRGIWRAVEVEFEQGRLRLSVLFWVPSAR